MRETVERKRECGPYWWHRKKRHYALRSDVLRNRHRRLVFFFNEGEVWQCQKPTHFDKARKWSPRWSLRSRTYRSAIQSLGRKLSQVEILLSMESWTRTACETLPSHSLQKIITMMKAKTMMGSRVHDPGLLSIWFQNCRWMTARGYPCANLDCKLVFNSQTRIFYSKTGNIGLITNLIAVV